MSTVVSTLPAGAVVREMDTLAFKEFMMSGVNIARGQNHDISYLESDRGGYVYISNHLANACDRFFRTIHIKALEIGSTGDAVMAEGGLMLWDPAGVNQGRRNFYFNHPKLEEINMSILAVWTRLPE